METLLTDPTPAPCFMCHSRDPFAPYDNLNFAKHTHTDLSSGHVYVYTPMCRYWYLLTQHSVLGAQSSVHNYCLVLLSSQVCVLCVCSLFLYFCCFNHTQTSEYNLFVCSGIKRRQFHLCQVICFFTAYTYYLLRNVYYVRTYVFACLCVKESSSTYAR